MNSTKPFPKISGFARGELLLVAALVVLLSQVLLSAFTRVRNGNQTTVCRNNSRLLITAWQMYQNDNNHFLVEGYHGGESFPVDIKKSTWARGWLDWTTSPDNTNTLFLADARFSRVAPYLGNDAKVFKCPSDNFLASQQRLRGWKSRVRSYSLNLGIGAGNVESGPWSPVYRHFKKMDEISAPSMTWVFIEENADSLNDPGFFNPTGRAGFVDQPASYHEGAANVSFSDGHVETHLWKSSLSTPAANRIHYVSGVIQNIGSNDEDVPWLSARGGLLNPTIWIGAPIR
jgi:prepilin-type processing-associated H-X9-DG protein